MQRYLWEVYNAWNFQFCEKRIVSNPKGINRKSWCLLFCSLMLREDVKKKLNMTDKVKYESWCDWTFSQKSNKVSALIFWKNPIWGFLKNRARWKFWQMGQWRNFHFVRRVYRGRSPLCRECKGVQLHARVKGQSPLSGQGWNALPSDLMPASSRTGYYLANCVTQNHFREWPPHEKSLWNARGR